MNENRKANKCGCGKTKDPNGNCDGSHAAKTATKQSVKSSI